MLLRTGVLVLGLAIAPLCASGAEPQQDSSHPEWHFLPTDYVDTWTGAFHDSSSGAFIAFERGFRSMLNLSVPSVAAEHHGTLVRDKKGTWAYSYVVLPVAPRAANYWSDSCAEDRKQYQRIEASFTSDAAPSLVWNFTAFTCAEQERVRVIDFLFQDPNRWSSLMEAQQSKVHALRERDIARLVRGESLDRLQPMLGLATAVERRGAGFDLSFSLVVSRAPTNARLRFDKAGKLVDWKLEPPPALP